MKGRQSVQWFYFWWSRFVFTNTDEGALTSSRTQPAVLPGPLSGFSRVFLTEGGGKFIICDQCAYGKVDKESLKPIKKPTVFLSSDEVLLNHVGNRFGRRSTQAAAYPAELCRAICLGILESMKFEYALNVPHELAYPVEEEAEDMDVEQDPVLNLDEQLDRWEIFEDRLVRWHQAPRKALFSPMSVDGLPCCSRMASSCSTTTNGQTFMTLSSMLTGPGQATQKFSSRERNQKTQMSKSLRSKRWLAFQ